MRKLPAACAVLVLAGPLAAQDAGAGAATDSTAQTCPSGRIEHVFIDNHSIFDTTDPDLDPRVEWAYRLANRLHVRTEPAVIERELLFAEGDCFDPERIEESERLLRGLGFLSDVDVYGVPQEDGGYDVVVDTQDEWSTKAYLQVGSGLSLDGGQIEESNLLGSGRSVDLFYLDHSLARSYGAAYQTPQLLGTRWDFGVRGGSTRAGTFFEEYVSYPFVGELGKWASRQSFRRRDRYFDLVAAGAPSGASPPPREEIHLLMPVREKAMEVGIVRRFGRIGALNLLGGALSFQEISYPGGRQSSVLVLGSQIGDSTAAVAPYLDPVWTRLQEVQTIRAFFLIGHRSVDWVQRVGLDALAAEQDVRVGSEVGLAIGRSLPGLQTADDMFGTITFFTGWAPGDQFVFSADARVDARRDFDAPVGSPEWRDVLGETRLVAYLTPHVLPRHTLVARVLGSGGWNNVTPFQLTLGGPRALRGFEDWRYPGGRRIVATVEDRYYVGWPFPDLFDLGLTAGADVGRVWPGDLPYPYGTDSSWKASVALGMRANFPAGGRTTYRIDVAAPVNRSFRLSQTRLLFSVGESIGLSARPERPQVQRSRLSSLSGDVFNFPR